MRDKIHKLYINIRQKYRVAFIKYIGTKICKKCIDKYHCEDYCYGKSIAKTYKAEKQKGN